MGRRIELPAAGQYTSLACQEHYAELIQGGLKLSEERTVKLELWTDFRHAGPQGR